MNKVLTIILITILSIITFGLIVGLWFLIKTDFSFSSLGKFNFASTESTNLIESKEIITLKDLDIKTDVTDVNIEETDNETIKIELYSDNAINHEITENENNIKVVLEEKKKVGFYLFKKNPVVRIYLPKGYNKNIVADSNVGDIKIGHLPNATLNAQLDVGDVKVKEINTADVVTRVGDVKIENVNKLVTDVKTGDIKVQQVNNITSKSKTGDVKLGTVKGSVDITTGTGDVKIENATIEKNSKIDSNVGDVKINNIKGCYVEAKTNIGDVKVTNNDRKSEIELTIISHVGDIKVY